MAFIFSSLSRGYPFFKEELSLLRERITSKAGTDDMNEAFRAEIDSLKAEINHLKQTGRERDRELADQQDKNEEISAKVEAVERERTLLIQNVNLFLKSSMLNFADILF